MVDFKTVKIAMVDFELTQIIAMMKKNRTASHVTFDSGTFPKPTNPCRVQ
jgi:hypothetical protein